MFAVAPMHVCVVGGGESGRSGRRGKMAPCLERAGVWIENGVVVNGVDGDADNSAGGDSDAVVEGERLVDDAAECHFKHVSVQGAPRVTEASTVNHGIKAP